MIARALRFCSFCLTLAFVLTWSNSGSVSAQESEAWHMFVGTYTSGKSEGIYRVAFDAMTGEMSSAELAAKTENPSFLAIAPNRKYLYAVNELTKFRDQVSGGVTAFAVDTGSGGLKELNQQPSMGGAPCHIVVDATGKHVLVANYVGGNVASLPIADDGSLKPASSVQQHKGSSKNPQRQKAPHAHSINLDAANRFAVAADLGIDQLLVYRFEPGSGALKLEENAGTAVDPGAGPRHFVFHPSGKFAYAINELHLTVTVMDYDASTGSLRPKQTISTLPASVTDRKGLSTAEVRVSPDGKLLFGSNRGHDTIAMFSIDASTGKLESLGHYATGGRTPRNFNLSPDGKFLLAANQSTSNIVAFHVDAEQGRLTSTGQSIYVPNPVCIRFVRSTANGR